MNEELVTLDFNIVREPWNMYELRDGSILKAKYVLTRVIKYEGIKDYHIRGRSITTIHYAPEDMKGQPSETLYSPEEIMSSIVEEDIGYRTLMEEWSEYVVEDGGKIRVKLTVLRVSRTSKYDNVGVPMYCIDTKELVEQVQRIF